MDPCLQYLWVFCFLWVLYLQVTCIPVITCALTWHHFRIIFSLILTFIFSRKTY